MAHTPETRARAYEKIVKRKDDWFAENGPCVHCSSWERLELDHINPEDKVSHRVWSWAEERRLAELAKCQALCHECHKAKTKAQIEVTEHGATMYRKGCRCQVCKSGHAADRAEYRARTGRR